MGNTFHINFFFQHGKYIISIIIVFQKEKFELPEMPEMPEMPEIKLPEAVQETLDEITI